MDNGNSKSVCRPLPKDVRSIVRSGIAITSMAQCVQELVLNSIDGKAGSIYIGVNLERFNVTVEDDGIGISKHDLNVIGTRYTTSKCHSIDDLSALKHYGYRGEALASIIDVSTSVELISRTAESVAPYRRQFSKGKPKGNVEKVSESKKKSHGLSVIVCNLLSQLPVRQKRIDRSIQVEEIKSILQQIILVNPTVCIEFRNESNGSQVLKYTGTNDVVYAFKLLFGCSSGVLDMNFLEEHHCCNGIFITGCISKDTYRSNGFQFVYVNQRYIGRNKIYRYLNKSILTILAESQGAYDKKEIGKGNSTSKEKFPVFIINIKCAYDKYDITFEPKKLLVEFRDWEVLVKVIDGLCLSFKTSIHPIQKGIVRKNTSFAVSKSKKNVKDKCGGSTCSEDGETRRDRKSISSTKVEATGNESGLGEGITTHDLKRAVHSRFAVRKSSALKQAESPRSHVTCSDKKSLRSNSAGGHRSRLSRATISPSSAASEDVNGKSCADKDNSQSSSRSYRLVTSKSRKTNVYDLRRVRGNRVQKRENIFPTGAAVKPRVYVQSKAKVNANVFKKFPYWAENIDDSPTTLSTDRVLSKNWKQTQGKSRDTKIKAADVNVKGGFSQGRNEEACGKPTSKKAYDPAVDPLSALNSEDEGFNWKIHRYINEIGIRQNAKSTSSESVLNDDVDSVDDHSDGTKIKEKAEDEKRMTRKNAKAKDDDLIYREVEKSKTSTTDKDETTCSDPSDWTWSVDVSVEGVKQIHDSHFNRVNRGETLKNELRKKLISTETGVGLFRMLQDPPSGVQSEKQHSTAKNEPVSILAPPFFGQSYGSCLPTFRDLSHSSLQSQKSVNAQRSTYTLPQQAPEVTALPIPLPTPSFGLKQAMKSQDATTKIESSHSVWTFQSNSLPLSFASQERRELQRLKLTSNEQTKTKIPSFQGDAYRPIPHSAIFGEKLREKVEETNSQELPISAGKRHWFSKDNDNVKKPRGVRQEFQEQEEEEEESSQYFMNFMTSSQRPISKSQIQQRFQQSHHELPRCVYTSEYFDNNSDLISPSFIINGSASDTNAKNGVTETKVCYREEDSSPKTPLLEALMLPPENKYDENKNYFVESPYFSPAADKLNDGIEEDLKMSQVSNVTIEEIEMQSQSNEPDQQLVIRRENTSNVLPAPCDILPSQILERAGGEWSDRMIFDQDDEYNDEWGSWEVDIVTDSKGQDWLQTEDEQGKTIYINLSTADASYDMIHSIGTGHRKVPALQAAKMTKKFRYNWLRRYFPKGSHQFWEPQGKGGSKIALNGNISLVDKDATVLGNVVRECIKNGNIDNLEFSKWRSDVDRPTVGDHSERMDEDGIRYSEPFNPSLGKYEMPVSNLKGAEMKVSSKMRGTSLRLVKQDLARVKVLTQLDRKFIVATISTLPVTEKKSDLLVLFDQHAVHERIRLEQLIRECYTETKSGDKVIQCLHIVPPITLNFSDTEVRIMQSYENEFESIGVKVKPCSSTSVKISSTPNCFAEKVAAEPLGNREEAMKKLLCTLLQEQVRQIIETKGKSNTIPKTIFNILCSQACHGAIKFGDTLALSVCEDMISSLKNCKTPFQCAHGRPVIFPLLDLASYKNAIESEFQTRHEQEQHTFGSQTNLELRSSQTHEEHVSCYFQYNVCRHNL